jgi:hypothetical protein
VRRSLSANLVLVVSNTNDAPVGRYTFIIARTPSGLQTSA